MVTEIPKLRQDLVVRRIPGQDEVSYVVKDPVTRKYYRFPEAAGQLLAHLDGRTSLSALQQRLLAGAVPAQRVGTVPSLEALEDFVQQLRALDLLELSPAQRMEHQLERLRRERGLRIRSRNAFGSLLYARFSVWDPDRWMDRVVPRLRFFWTPTFFVISLVAIVVSMGIVWAHWDRFGEALQQLFSGRAGLQQYVLFASLSLVVIAIHELGHGLTCKRFGGHVHEIGFLLMFFMPCLYCNVNDAWLFERRRERLWVTVAGGYIELFLGALAVFVWWLTAPGHPVNEIAFQTALIASVSSVAANLNPLIKLDAYYGLSDALGIPNLREHSFRYLRTMVPHFLFGRQVAVPGLSARRRRIFLAYGLLAGAYSLTLLILFARHAFEFLVNRSGDWGVIAFLALAFFMIRPAVGSRRRAVGEAGGGGGASWPRSGQRRGPGPGSSVRRLAGTFVGLPSTAYRLAAAFLVLAGLAMIPRWAMPVRLRCVFEPARQVVLYAPEDAQVVDVLFTEGQRVEAGQPLLLLRATELRAELTRARLQLAIRRLREQEARVAGDLRRWRAEQRQADAERGEVDQLERRATGLTVSSPLAGVCLTPRPRDLLGRTLTRGTPLVTVGDTTQLLAVAHVEPDATGDVGPGAPAQAMPYSLPGTVLRGRVRDLLPAGSSAPSGFRLTVPVANPGAVRPGMSGSLKVYGPARSLLGHLREAALRLLRADAWG